MVDIFLDGDSHNHVERWLGLLTDQHLGLGVANSVATTTPVATWIAAWNADPSEVVQRRKRSSEDLSKDLSRKALVEA